MNEAFAKFVFCIDLLFAKNRNVLSENRHTPQLGSRLRESRLIGSLGLFNAVAAEAVAPRSRLVLVLFRCFWAHNVPKKQNEN